MSHIVAAQAELLLSLPRFLTWLSPVVRSRRGRLLPRRFVCYKPDMRKWMRDRLQRRKKKAPEKTGEAAPPPLQPAYFEAEQAAATPPEAAEAVEDLSSSRLESSQPESFQRESRTRSRDEGSSAHAPEPVEPVEQDERTSRASRVPQEDRPAEQLGAEAGAQRGRPRRRRGGRGRGGRGREQAVAQAFTPAAAKGAIPGALVEEEAPAELAEVPSAVRAAASQIPKAPPSAVPIAAPRPPKGLVVLAIGLPGSGKSTWFKRHNVVPLSSDLMRSLLFDDVREQRFQDLVFSNLRSMLKARLIAKRPTNYVDATNLTPQERQHWIKLAKDYGYEVHAVFFDVPLEVCVERHQRRDRVVPEDVMRRMAAKLKPPAFEEGFAKITVVRVKKKEGTA
jgi:predicted kinase